MCVGGVFPVLLILEVTQNSQEWWKPSAQVTYPWYGSSKMNGCIAAAAGRDREITAVSAARGCTRAYVQMGEGWGWVGHGLFSFFFVVYRGRRPFHHGREQRPKRLAEREPYDSLDQARDGRVVVSWRDDIDVAELQTRPEIDGRGGCRKRDDPVHQRVYRLRARGKMHAIPTHAWKR